MPDANSLAVLQNLFAQGGGGADALKKRSLEQQFASEAEDQIASESGDARTNPVSAANVLRKGLFLKGLERDLNEDPNTGLDAQAAVAHNLAQDQQVMDYNDPGQTQMRNDEFSRKLRLATAPAQTQGEFALRAAHDKGANQAEIMQSMLAGGGGDRSVSMAGVGSVGAPPHEARPTQIPGSVLNKYTTARGAMEKASQGGVMSTMKGFLGMDPTNGARGAMEAARREALGYVVPSHILDAVEQHAPAFQPGMSIDQKLQIMGDTPIASREEFEALKRALLEY